MAWREIDLIVQALEEHYPDLEIEDLTIDGLRDLIMELSEITDVYDSRDDTILKKIMETWQELRQGDNLINSIK